MKKPGNRRRPVVYPADCIELPPFPEWFESSMRSHDFATEYERSLVMAYSVPPMLKAIVFKACRAYGNHWRTIPSLQSLVDCDSSAFRTFDSSMACTFAEKRTNRAGVIRDDSIEYAGVLTEIIELNYGGMKVVLFKGRWANPSWKPKKTASMRYHESGLWQVNFQKEIGTSRKMDYVFPRQVEQVFFYPNDKGVAWRTILHKESRSARVVGDYMEESFVGSTKNIARHHVDLAEACMSRSDPSKDPKKGKRKYGRE